MPKLVAIHEIVRDDENGKRVAVQPGKSFTASKEEAVYLKELGAAKDAVKEEGAEAPAEETNAGLEDMTKAELLALAEQKGVEVDKQANKATILAAIQAADSELI